MARSLYITVIAIPGATSGTLDSEKSPVVVSRTKGGSAETDLLTEAGVAITQPDPNDVTGRTAWQGPDGYNGAMWVQDPTDSSVWWEVPPVGLADRTGAVSSVNTKTGAVTLNADDIGDGTTNKAYTATEKTKLAGVATGATANSTDTFLRTRTNGIGKVSSQVALSDIDLSAATSGAALFVDPADGIVRTTAFPSPTASTLATTDLTDFDATTPATGALAVWDGNSWNPLPGGLTPLSVLVLNTGQPLPVGAPPGVYFRKAATTLIRTHTVEGTSGTAAGFAAMGYDALSGATANYSNAQALVGTTSALIGAGNQTYYSDTGLALDTIVVKRRVRLAGAPTGVINFAEMRSTTGSIAALQRTATGTIALKDGAGTTRLTTTATFGATSWFIFEWKVGGGSQQLRWYDSSYNLIQDTGPTSATAGQVDTSRHGIVLNAANSLGMYFDNGAVAGDWMGAGIG